MFIFDFLNAGWGVATASKKEGIGKSRCISHPGDLQALVEKWITEKEEREA
jgi:hypothetical protein